MVQVIAELLADPPKHGISLLVANFIDRIALSHSNLLLLGNTGRLVHELFSRVRQMLRFFDAVDCCILTHNRRLRQWIWIRVRMICVFRVLLVISSQSRRVGEVQRRRRAADWLSGLQVRDLLTNLLGGATKKLRPLNKLISRKEKKCNLWHSR